MSRNRSRIDDFSFLFKRLEFLRSSLNAPQNALDVNLQNPLYLRRRDIEKRLHLSDPGVVHHDVEGA